jgi:hypothetical protein
MRRTVVFDSGAVIAAERNDERIRAIMFVSSADVQIRNL